MRPDPADIAARPSPLGGEGGAKRRVRGREGTIAVGRARKLRRGQTEAETRLWMMVRNRSFRGLKFVRQFPIDTYIVDSVCRERMLVVEIDGSQHLESSYDAKGTAILNRLGYSVLRFWNDEVVSQRDGVYQLLTAALSGDVPSPGWRYSPATLSPAGRGATGGAIGSSTK